MAWRFYLCRNDQRYKSCFAGKWKQVWLEFILNIYTQHTYSDTFHIIITTSQTFYHIEMCDQIFINFVCLSILLIHATTITEDRCWCWISFFFFLNWQDYHRNILTKNFITSIWLTKNLKKKKPFFGCNEYPCKFCDIWYDMRSSKYFHN